MKRILSIFIFLQFNNVNYAQTSITIYKDDRALIKQKILWELEQESNVISWDSLPSGLIDGSAFLNLKNARILTQRLNNNTFRFRENLKNKIGENIEIKLVNEREISGVLVEFDNSILSVQRRGSILSFNFDKIVYEKSFGKLSILLGSLIKPCKSFVKICEPVANKRENEVKPIVTIEIFFIKFFLEIVTNYIKCFQPIILYQKY